MFLTPGSRARAGSFAHAAGGINIGAFGQNAANTTPPFATGIWLYIAGGANSDQMAACAGYSSSASVRTVWTQAAVAVLQASANAKRECQIINSSVGSSAQVALGWRNSVGGAGTTQASIVLNGGGNSGGAGGANAWVFTNLQGAASTTNGGSGPLLFQAGNGGNAASGAGTNTGGVGGSFTFTAGNGGNSTLGSGTNAAGNGGSFTFNTGSPGTASGGSVNNAGANGTITFQIAGVSALTIDASSVVRTNIASFILGSKTTITGGATGNAPTLTAGPVTGNPTKWLPYDDNGTTRYIPSW
jgi:hypothetical protein